MTREETAYVPGARIVAAASFAFLLYAAGSTAAADPPRPDPSRFASFLAAGEFGLARQIAESGGGARDQLLQQLAVAQARGGAWGASLVTARDIQDDQVRQSAYGQLSRRNSPGAARGGAALADFDSLIELIKSTISPDSWDDAGGTGAVEPFPGGVYVDSSGALRRIERSAGGTTLAAARRMAFSDSGNREVRRQSALRKVSLTRLERQAEWLAAQGKRPDEAMRVLAGLTKIQYVFCYPESRDIVIAGPAEDWKQDGEGRWVGTESGLPVLHLDDLVILLRNGTNHGGRFSCSITPRQENLASVQTFLQESAKRSLRPGERTEWLKALRERLGDQDITVQGIDPQSHAAKVLVEADYRMKLVGMGLEPGVLGVKSYLDSLSIAPGMSPPPMDVLRWWFTLNYDAIKGSEARDAFEIVGQGVKVLSENELLTERGERVHTGGSQHLNQQFAHSFTRHFTSLAAKYPVYAELRNIFDLALLVALVRGQDLAGQCDWQMLHFGSEGGYAIERFPAPKHVASVLNFREIDRQRFVVGVSGGVSVDTGSWKQPTAVTADTYGLIKAERGTATPPQLPASAWWWD